MFTLEGVKGLAKKSKRKRGEKKHRNKKYLAKLYNPTSRDDRILLQKKRNKARDSLYPRFVYI